MNPILFIPDLAMLLNSRYEFHISLSHIILAELQRLFDAKTKELQYSRDEVPSIFPLLPNILSNPTISFFPYFPKEIEALNQYSELYNELESDYFEIYKKSIPKVRTSIIQLQNKQLLPNEIIIIDKKEFFPDGNTIETDYLKTPNGGKFTIGQCYEYPTGEKAYQDGSVELPNGISIMCNGYVKLTKDILAPSSLTGQPKQIKYSQHFTLQPNGIYQIHGKKIFPNGEIEYRNKKSILLPSAIQYNQTDISNNLKSFFQNCYNNEMPLP